MPQIINLLILMLGLSLTGFGLAIFRGSSILYVILPVGVGLVLVAMIADKRRKKREMERQRSDISERIAQLTQTPWQSHQTLEIRSSQGLIFFVLITGLMSIGSIYAGLMAAKIIWPLVLGGAAFLFLSMIMLPGSIAILGKPACIFDKDGFAMPIHGRISWQAIDGIALEQYTIRGVTQSTIIFKVPDYQHVAAGAHWSIRLLASVGLGPIKRNVVGMLIKQANENPETIYAVARYLWREATARNYEWSPRFSNEYHEAAKRINKVTKQPLDGESLARRLQESPQSILDEMESTNADLKLMRDEQSRRLVRSNWLSVMAVILALFFLGWALLRKF